MSRQVVYTQSFPEKFLAGDYEFEGNILGPRMNNRGKFTLALCKYNFVLLHFLNYYYFFLKGLYNYQIFFLLEVHLYFLIY